MSCRPNQDWLRSLVGFFFAMSVCRPAARDIEYRARRKRTILGGEPAHERGDLLRRDEAVHRDFRKHVFDVFLRPLVEDRGLRCRRSEDSSPERLSAQALCPGTW